MYKIGVTQSLEMHEIYRELREYLDSRWIELLSSFNYFPLCLSSFSSMECIHSLDFDGFILTGGKSIGTEFSAQRDKFELDLLQYAAKHGKPVLGVCRGFQMMNHYFGGTLKSIKGHAGVVHKVKFFNHFSVEVNSYHNQVIDFIEEREFKVLARGEDESVEAVIHKHLPWIGIMWHPEREPSLTKISKLILKNLFDSFSHEGFEDACHNV